MIRNTDMKPRLGMVNFINTAPVYIPWKEGHGHDGWDVIEGTPTELNRLLGNKELEAGLVSSYEYGLGHDKYLVLPDLAISATGAVGSVLLFSRYPLQELSGRVVGLSPQSATSVNLLRIIFEKFYNVRPRYRTGCFTELEQGDAAAYLSIGDEALRMRSGQKDYHQYDLAQIWLDETGMPFVFAVCAVRKEFYQQNPELVKGLGEAFATCRRVGSDDLDRISDMAAKRIPMDRRECQAYLMGIELDLSEDKQEGLMEFFRMLSELGDFPAVKTLGLV